MERDCSMTGAHAETLVLLQATYLMLHWACKTCCAAGQGRGRRCTIGADLSSAYDLEAVP